MPSSTRKAVLKGSRKNARFVPPTAMFGAKAVISKLADINDCALGK
jgi:hypothetical protein